MDFILSAINEHKSSDLYKTAVAAEKYYDGENPTINAYEKIIYDARGLAHKDMWTANHKIASSFFGLAVDQEAGYLLGNGVTFKYDNTKDRLGNQTNPFDQQVMDAGRKALIGGASFGFWNLDHIDVFSAKEYIPLIDEENGAMMAGIRFWQLDGTKPLRATLFEMDGYTDYIRRSGEDMQERTAKRPYIIHTIGSKADIERGDAIYRGENYPGFPIVPLKNGDNMKSEICGKRNTIDALDLVSSNMVNNVDEGNVIYWILKNYGGMDDMDRQRFVEQLKTTHVVNTDGDGEVEAHSIEAPVVGTQTAIDTLTKRLYQDFQAFDASAVTAGNQTATAIKASYVPLDLKVDRLELQVTKFINGICAIAGVDDEPSYTRNKLINTQEEMQTLMTAAPYLDSEYITTKALTIMGDPDMVDEIMNRQAAENLDRFNKTSEDGNVPSTDEAIDAAEEAVGKTLNGSQTSSLITVIKGLKNGDISEGQAIRILTTSIGVSREEALAIIRGE